MDGMSMTMSMSMGPESSSTTQSTFSSTAPTSTAGVGGSNDMGGMGQTGSMNTIGDSCRVSMLWNWETIDACFLSESWQVKSRGGFAGLCIGVVLLVILLEFLRRAIKIYDQSLVRQHQKAKEALAATAVNSSTDTADGALIEKEHGRTIVSSPPIRPKIWQQGIRALLHTLHFALAYWIMLLAMYYNGYIIICIIIGAFIGFFIFQWENIGPRNGTSDGIGMGRDATGCHG
ncbi:Ctr-domain-containing protein [Hypoxylon trugodes]|uniref:Ctr-domain-containing protein n=1 Tax=Hypoxylon trugodes TaxID=326681 RepID=UPI0021900063|nr:Ctr-domain-containing protein [Hypoxylon trugodes]KAI1384342.1 Ctr-domain-containing protein [Hypoxylon trugodes]